MIPISNVLLVPEVNAFKHSLYETKTVFLKYGIKLLDYQGNIWPFTKNEQFAQLQQNGHIYLRNKP